MSISLIKNIERVINSVLQLDEESYKNLIELAGKIIAIEISGLNITVYLNLTSQGVELKSGCADAVDVTIKAPAMTFFTMLLTGRGEQSVSVGDMEITGDVGLAQQFQSTLKMLEIDWEEYISTWVGDYSAHKLGNIFRDARKYMKESKEIMGMNISEYLRYEKELLPEQIEIDEFNSAVDVIRSDSERLNQRIIRYQRKIIESV
jgi:ubiquinone biosynthesis protein UbiJ